MRWIRRLLIIIAALAVVAAVLIILLFTVDLGQFKGTVENVISDRTGRQFTIDGRFETSLGSAFDLTAEDVQLANADWGTAENILELEHVTISVDTWSLIRGPIRVLNLEVKGLQIHTERNPETLRHSWLFRGKPRRLPGTPRRRFELPLWLNTADLEDIRVTYGLGWTDRSRTVSISTAEFFADESDLLRMNLEGAIDGEPVKANGMVGPLRALIDGHEPRWELEVSSGQFLAATEGTFIDLFRAQGPTIHAIVRGPEAEHTLDRLGLPPLATGPIDIEANIETVADGIKLLVEGAFGNLRTDVVARTESFKTLRDLDLSLDIGGPDLQAVGALFGAGFLPTRAFEIKGAVTGRHNDLRLDSVIVTAGDAKLEADGRLASPEVDPDAELLLTAGGPEILEFLPPALRERVPSGAFEVRGSATGDPRLIQLNEFSARLNDFELLATGTIPVGAGWPGLDLTVNGRGPDFAQLVEPWYEADVLAEAYSIDVRIRNEGNGFVLDDLDLSVGDAYLKIDGTAGVFPTLRGMDATVSLGGEDLQAAFEPLVDVGLPAAAFRVDGKFVAVNNVLQLTGVEFRLGKAHGTVNGVSGRLPSLDGLRLRTTLEGPDASQFSAVLGGREEGGILAGRAFQTHGSLAKTNGVWSLNPWVLEIAESRLELRGSLGDVAGVQGIDLQFSATGPDLRRFLPEQEIDLPLPYEIEGGLKVEGGSIQLRQVDVQIAETTAFLDGTVPTSSETGGAEFRLTAAGPSLETLGFVFGAPYLPAERYRVEGSLTRAGEAYSGADFKATVGSNDISGDFVLEFGDRPRLRGNFASENLDLTTWLPEEAESDQDGDDVEQRVIPDTELPLSILDVADLDIALRLHHLKSRRLDVGDIELKILMEGDELHLETGKVSLTSGGDLSATLDLTRTNDARADVKIDAVGKGFQLRTGVDADGNPINRPREDLEMSLAANGSTLRELAASANGKFSLRLGEGQVENDFGGNFVRDVFSQILLTILPFAEDEKFTQLECGFIETDIVDGVLRSRAVGFQTDRISLASVGTVDLESEAMDLSFRVKQREGIGVSVGSIVNPYVRVGGTMAAPSYEFNAKRGLISGTVAFLTGGLSILAQGVWDRHLAKDNYCEAMIEAIDAGEIPVWDDEIDE